MAQMLMSSGSKAMRPAGIQHKAPATPSRCVRLHALSTSSSSSGLNRRDIMAAGMALMGMLPSWGAYAEPCAVVEDEAQGDDCRKAALQKDGGVNVDYNKKSNEKKFTAAGGVPVSVLDDEYSRVTFKLADDIQLYASSDVEDYKQRIPLIKTLKTDATNWVSKYARGGSARKESSRRMYIAVDSVIGHIASQGYAPMPAKKLDKVLSTIEQAKGLMAEGK